MWGPCRIESVQGFRYFIVFIDDFSRLTWVYLLKDRTQVVDVIKIFVYKIKTQFCEPLRVFRTDNALEYVQRNVSLLCEAQGVIHQTSCPRTSQQNGVAERKHHHLLDVTKTLMT